jgi:hypothetical protein
LLALIVVPPVAGTVAGAVADRRFSAGNRFGHAMLGGGGAMATYAILSMVRLRLRFGGGDPAEAFVTVVAVSAVLAAVAGAVTGLLALGVSDLKHGEARRGYSS